MTQTIITSENGYAGLDAWIEQTGAKTILLVCDESIKFLKDISAHFEQIESRGNKTCPQLFIQLIFPFCRKTFSPAAASCHRIFFPE